MSNGISVSSWLMIYDSKAMQLGLERERTFASGKEGSFIRMSRWNSFMRGLWPTRKGMKERKRKTPPLRKSDKSMTLYFLPWPSCAIDCIRSGGEEEATPGRVRVRGWP